MVVIAALMIPVFLLLGALVVDAGNWYTHKRSLQNRADAGALAAGLEYVGQLKNCLSTPGTTGTQIANVAKSYAGTNEPVGTTYNKNVNNQANVTVVINATSPTAADWSDGGSPCADHAGDGWSPAGGLWTDVKIREGNIGTLFGSFGINLPKIAAQARVEVNPIIGIAQNGLPFVNETGDQIECVWAKFVRARDGSTTGFTVTPSNPIQLTESANHTWTGNVDEHPVHERATTTSRSNTGPGARTARRPATSRTRPRDRYLTRSTTIGSRWRSTGSTSTTPAPRQGIRRRRSSDGSRSARALAAAPASSTRPARIPRRRAQSPSPPRSTPESTTSRGRSRSTRSGRESVP